MLGRPKRKSTPILGAKIRKLRESRKLTQPAFGLLCGVNANTVCRWEKGKVTPADEHLAFLAHEFKRPRAWLIPDC
jgi:transcriptional regulator with XRE-family HTH domain